MPAGSTRRSGPRPYYERDGITIYNADWRDVWQGITGAGNSPAVIVTDPPYGVSYRSKRGQRVAGDRSTDLRDALLEAWGDRPALVFGTWRAGRPQCRALLVWDKGKSPGMGDLSLPWGPGHEEIYVRGKGWVKPDKRRPDVLHFDVQAANAKDRPRHPTPKPVPLMRHLLERCPAGVVLDPFMGSGSTLVAAKELGRQAIGCEIEERYCAMTAERLEATSRQRGTRSDAER